MLNRGKDTHLFSGIYNLPVFFKFPVIIMQYYFNINIKLIIFII